MFAPWKESYDKPRQHIKKQRHHFANKGLYSQSYGFFSSHVRMWELDHKEGWAPKNWRFQTVVLEKTLENPLDSKNIKLVNPKGNKPWIFIGRTILKLWYFGHLMQRAGSLEKTPMLGKIRGKRRMGRQRIRWLDGITDSVDVNLSKFQKTVKDKKAWHAAIHGVAKSWTWISDWTTVATVAWEETWKVLTALPREADIPLHSACCWLSAQSVLIAKGSW